MVTGAKTIDKALSIFKYALNAQRPMAVAEIAIESGLPVATVYRHVAAFERAGLVRRDEGGRLSAGVELLRALDPARFRKLFAELARPMLIVLSRRLDATAHLGVLEQDMVTYLVKAEAEGEKVFTIESQQLEAYCSGVGKVLLANLCRKDLDKYLSGGPFPALTEHTITDPGKLRRELSGVRRRGYAIDRAEIEHGLYCVAAPVLNREGEAIGAVSASARNGALIGSRRKKVLASLFEAAEGLAEAISRGW